MEISLPHFMAQNRASQATRSSLFPSSHFSYFYISN